MVALPTAMDDVRYLMNIYAPAGAQAKQARSQFYSDLALELNAWPDAKIAVMGDFQEPLSQSLFFLQLAATGWRIPPF